MVAELTGIPVSSIAPGRSSQSSNVVVRTSRILGCRVSCSTSTSASTSTSSSTANDDDDEHHQTGNRRRPRWIRAATREPIYSVLDDRDNTGRLDRSTSAAASPPLRGIGRGKTREYEISAVRNRDSCLGREDEISAVISRENRLNRDLPTVGDDPPPIYRPSSCSGVCDSRERREEVVEEEEEENEEEALYSVVRKPPKNLFGDAARLPVLREEEALEPREEVEEEEASKKRRELHKWLQNASGEGGDEGARKRRKTRMDREECGEEAGESRKGDDTWSSAGVSMPRGVVGMVGPFRRIYRDPNEQRECMLREEVRERGVDVGGAADGEKNHRMEEDEVDYVEEAVDSLGSESTFVGDADELRNREIDEDSLVVEEMEEAERIYRRRAKWRIVDEGEERECMPEKIVEVEAEDEKKSMKSREWPKENVYDDAGRLGHPGAREGYDLDVPPKYTKRSDASNEPHDKDSLNETGSTTGGTVEGNHSGNPARGERSGGPSDPAASGSSPERRPISATAAPRSLVSRILARARSPDDLLDHSEPYSQLWIVLSNVYGELVVVLMMALCLAEVMDTPVPLLSLQSIYLMYLYVGSIAVIISIYLWVLVDSCGSLANGNSGTEDAELGGASLTRFGSLKRAHISRARTAPTSFYIRVGALLFGLATLVFNGLEMAMHSMMQGAECLSDVVFVHPVLHGLFTFLQMHFLFVNSQVLVERFGLAARFGFTHLAATNIAVWARLVIWDSAQEWTYFVHLAQRGPETSSSPLNLRGFPGSLTRRARDLIGRATSEGVVVHPYQPISDEQISQVVTLQECLNTNSLGQLWTSSMPFLYPFIVQFSLIAAAVTYVMGQNVGRNRYCHKQKFHSAKELTSHMRVGCDGSSKGLFLGILCMTAGIVVILIFLVVREDENFSPATLSWLTCGTLIGILALSGVMTASGLVQVRQMSVVSRAPAALDGILSNVALFGVQLYSVFTAVVCACSLATFDAETGDADSQGRHAMLLAASVLQLAQCFAQSTLIAETSKRSCITRFQMMAKPARQVITFLLFSNAVLWAFDTVVTQNWVSQELQLRFFGVLAWGIVSRICLPLVVFYRFHSCVLLLEAWNKCYRTPRGEHPLN